MKNFRNEISGSGDISNIRKAHSYSRDGHIMSANDDRAMAKLILSEDTNTFVPFILFSNKYNLPIDLTSENPKDSYEFKRVKMEVYELYSKYLETRNHGYYRQAIRCL